MGSMMQLIPVGYHEVVPGDTVSGHVDVHVISQPTFRPVLNRMYLDGYAVYIPFRLLWNEWPDHISRVDDSTTLPTVANLFPQNFEKWYCASATTNVAFLRRAYNRAFYDHFSYDGYDEEISLDDNSLHTVPMRQSTFERSVSNDPGDIDGEAIGTTTATLRDAFARENAKFAKEIYGEEYADYLRRIGVQSNPGLRDTTESIGKQQTDWKFKTVVNNGAAGEEGDSAGYFSSTVRIPINRTFCGEHGFIALFVCAKGDLFRTDGMEYPILAKQTVEDFWSPDQAIRLIEDWRPRLFNAGASLSPNQTFITPAFEDLRKGININADPSGGWGVPAATSMYGAYTGDSDTVDHYRTPASTTWDTFFKSDRMGHGEHFQITAQHRIEKKSPVAPAGVTPRLAF